MKNILFKIKEDINSKEENVNKALESGLKTEWRNNFIKLEIFENLLLFMKFTKDEVSNKYKVVENEFFLMDKDNNIYFISNNGLQQSFINSLNAPFKLSEIEHILVNDKLCSIDGSINETDGLEYIEGIFNNFMGKETFFIKGNGEVYSKKRFNKNNLEYFFKNPKTLTFTSKKKQKEVNELIESNPLQVLTKENLDILFKDSLALRYSNVSSSVYFDILDNYVVLRYFAFDSKRSDKLFKKNDNYESKEYMRIYIDNKDYQIVHHVEGRWTYNKSNIKSKYLFAGYNSDAFKDLKSTTNNRVAYLGPLLKGIDSIAGTGRDSEMSNGLIVLLYTLKYPFIEQLHKIGFNVNGFVHDIYKQTKNFNTNTKLDNDISSYAFAKLRVKETNSIYKVFNMTKDQINFLVEKEDYDFFAGDTNNPTNFRIGTMSKYDFISFLSKNNISSIGLDNFIYCYNVMNKYINSPEKVRLYTRSFLILDDEDFTAKDFENLLSLFNDIYLNKDKLFVENGEYLSCSLMAKIVNANEKSLIMVSRKDLIDPLYKTITKKDLTELEASADEVIQYYNDVMSEDNDPFKITKKTALELELKGEKYSVLRAKTFKDFKLESDSLNHCLYSSYRDAAYRGDSIIMFMRDNKNIKKPLYTIEVSNKGDCLKLVQVKGKNNCSIDTSLEKDFFNKWKNANNIN